MTRPSSGDPSGPSRDEETSYLNVDLEIGSTHDLRPVIDALSPRLFEMYRGSYGGLNRAHYELPGLQGKTPDETIRRLVRMLKKLGPAGQRALQRSRIRDFNVGVQAGITPSRTELNIEPRTVREVAELGGRIVFTIYAFDEKRARARRRKDARAKARPT